ncbi:MAG TPA: glucose-6-phosphate dehydrogenase, partial [Dermatophilaceae bacterium]
GDALAGEGALFTSAETVEAAWTVVDPILENHPRAHPYQPGSWGPTQAGDLIAAHGRWHNPAVDPKPMPSSNEDQGPA